MSIICFSIMYYKKHGSQDNAIPRDLYGSVICHKLYVRLYILCFPLRLKYSKANVIGVITSSA